MGHAWLSVYHSKNYKPLNGGFLQDIGKNGNERTSPIGTWVLLIVFHTTILH
jgi:hypothetical protein